MTIARLALQIFRKDIERLWLAVLLTLVLLAVFVWQDATRSVSVWSASNQGYGWLNLALPFAWSFLIALGVNQDPLAGDRQFWVSLPCGWQPLLAAKTAFIAASIQVPYFLATAAILIARGFNPLQHIPHLLWKQIVLLALILPALAVAVVVKNIAHFLLVVITVAGCIVIMSNRFNLYGQDTSWWDVRWNLALLVLGTGALVVTALQFARRYTLRARMIGIAAAVAAFGLYNWLSRDASAAIRAAISPAHVSAPISVTLGSRVPSLEEQRRYYNNRRTTILIPIEVSGLGSNAKPDQIGLELTAANGERYEAQWQRSSNDVRSERITAGLDMFYANRPSVQWLEIGSAGISKRVLGGPVTIHGRILARFYQPGSSTTLRPVGRTDVPGMGYCVVTNPAQRGFADGTTSNYECDSPEVAANEMLVNGAIFLRSQIAIRLQHYPEDPWLSPLHRGTWFLRFEPAQTIAPTTPLGGALIDYTFTGIDPIAPTTPLGGALIDYTFTGIDLNRFLVREAPR